MQINCPSCEIAYDVPEQKLRGRKLRCARCGTDWIPLAEVVREVAPTPAPPPPPISLESVSRPAVPAAATSTVLQPRLPISYPRRRARLVLLGWAATLLICAGGGFAIYHARNSVMHDWPPSIRFYRALGLGVHPTSGP